MDIGFAFIFPFLCNIQIYPIFHLSKYSNIQVVVVGRHDIRQVCIGLALKLYVLPFKYSYIQIFIYSNIQMARPFGIFGMMQKWPALWCNYKYSMMQQRKPFEIQRCGQILLLEKNCFCFVFFSISGEVANWFQLMFKS